MLGASLTFSDLFCDILEFVWRNLYITVFTTNKPRKVLLRPVTGLQLKILKSWLSGSRADWHRFQIFNLSSSGIRIGQSGSEFELKFARVL